ncbi:hypothetical protein EIP86_001170 [Pleurotus ostreatoroseus]|nr:hypothetical protein EIP86_001170 [Pleurotus ostreatoroseus]
MSAPKLRVAIWCPDVDVDVYEAARDFAEVGAGIGMWPRAWKVMQALGLQDDLARIAHIPPPGEPTLAFNFRKGDEAQGVTFQRLFTPGGLISLHRPDFQTALLRRLGPRVRTHTAKRLVSFAQPSPSQPSSSSHRKEPVRLAFADGTRAACDVLVGADGVRSAVRACMLAGPSSSSGFGADASAGMGAGVGGMGADAEEARKARCVWSGTMSYRAVVPAAALRARWPGHRVLQEPYVLYPAFRSTTHPGSLVPHADKQQVTVYPIAHGRLINVAAFRARYELESTPFDGPWVQDVPRAEMLRDFAGWEEEVRVLLEPLGGADRAPAAELRLGARGAPRRRGESRLRLSISRTAHAMMPYQGSGAGQAIEDAYVLATLLTHPHVLASLSASPNPHTLPRALAAYDAVRRPFAQGVAQRSRDAGVLYTLNAPGLGFPQGRDRAQDKARLREVAERLRAKWAWAWETTVEGDVGRAVGLLEGREG